MIEKPKRPKKIPNQDNKQPQTIQELIRRYDLDNTKIYDFLDEFVDSLNKKDTYSTDEQVVGTWIDGKPLYRKVIISNLPTTTVAGTNVSKTVNVVTNTDMRRIVSTWVIDSIGDSYALPYLSGTGQNGYLTKCAFKSTGELALMNANSALSNCSVVAILEYTKTTD